MSNLKNAMLTSLALGGRPSPERPDCYSFYREYHGHTVPDLQALLFHLKKNRPDVSVIYLAGDSSLDNKHWVTDKFGHPKPGEFLPGVNGYENALVNKGKRGYTRDLMLPDVAYFMNKKLTSEMNNNLVCVNCAVEESTTADRLHWTSHQQDIFVQENLSRNDILVVSVGGNDIALKSTMTTKWRMATGVLYEKVANMFGFRNDSEDVSGTVSWGMVSLMEDIFYEGVKNFVEHLCAFTKPKMVVVNMIYFLDENAEGDGWANGVLKFLQYDTQPGLLQRLIRVAFENATKKIKVEGTKIVPFALFDVLDGQDTEDYIARVEPSQQGGRKMADALVTRITQELAKESRL